MAIIDGVLNVVLRNPFEDKSKFFKKSQYVVSPRFILGTAFAFVGVFGFAASVLFGNLKASSWASLLLLPLLLRCSSVSFFYSHSRRRSKITPLSKIILSKRKLRRLKQNPKYRRKISLKKLSRLLKKFAHSLPLAKRRSLKLSWSIFPQIIYCQVVLYFHQREKLVNH